MNKTRLQQLAGLPLSESKSTILNERYEESSEFDADYDKVEAALNSALKIIVSSNWQSHMHSTDVNFDTQCMEESSKVELAIRDSIKTLKAFYEHIEQAA